MTNWLDADALKETETRISTFLEHFQIENPAVEAVDRGEASEPEPRWYVRLHGEAKDHTTIWLTLGQRTLRYETYVIPSPPKRAGDIYEFALRRNNTLVGAHFSIGAEDALYLRGELPVALVNDDELDRLLGTLFATVERYFPTLAQLAFR
jgi:Putative bacterial sensory transduction regulator